MDWQGKTHFFAIGAKMIRRILVGHARRKLSQKRGGRMHRIELSEEMRVSNRSHEDVLAAEEALEKLSKLDPRQAQIVELRFYGGLTVQEVAEVLEVSRRTVESDWTMVRAWLHLDRSWTGSERRLDCLAGPIRRIGDGGMGQVHEAKHLMLKRACAIKLIRSEQNFATHRSTGKAPSDSPIGRQ